MPVPKKHHTKSKVGRRRSHLALKKVNISVCTSCKGPVMPHRACAQCGFYENKKKQVRIKAKAEALATQQAEKATTAQQPAEKPAEKKEKAQPVVSAKKEEEKSAKETPQAEEAKQPQSEEVKEKK